MPNDLMPDVSSFADPQGNALLAKGWDPNEGLQSVQNMQQIQMNQQVQQLRAAQLSQEQLKLGQQQLGALHQQLGALVNNPTMNNFTNQLGLLVQNHVISPEAATQEATKVSGFNIGDPDAPNPQIKQYAFDHMSQVADHASLMETAYGTPSLVNTGKSLKPVLTRQGPGAGIYAGAGAAIPMATTPEFDNSKQTWDTPDGITHQGTNSQYQGAVGAGGTQGQGGSTFADIAAGRPLAPTGSGQNALAPTTSQGTPPMPPARPASATAATGSPAPAQGGAPTAMWTPTIATMPQVTQAQADAAAARVQAQQGTAADRNAMRAYVMQNRGTQAQPTTAKGMTFEPQPGQPPQAAGQGGAPVAPAPAPTEGAMPPGRQPLAPQNAGLAGPSPMLKGGIEDYRGDLNNSAAKLQGVQPLLNALPLIQQLGQTGAGPGTKAWNDAKSALVSAGVVPADATDVSIREEANKYLQQYVAKSALAGRSDQGQLQTQMSSPNLDTSQKATVALTQNAIAADRMDAARPLAMQGNDLSQYGQHRATWTQSQDLRAYKLDLMPQHDRTALMQSMAQRYQKNPNDPEARRFWMSVQNATKVNGIGQPAGGTQGGPNGQ